MGFHNYIIGHFVITLSILVHAQVLYKVPSSALCDGFPRISVATTENTCLGLVADTRLMDERTGEKFLFPRKIVELTPQRFLILDMGGWSPPNRGALWELDLQGPAPKIWKLMKGLHLPHGLGWGPDGSLYIGEAHRIVRLSRKSLLNRQDFQLEVVVGDLAQTQGRNLHPLINFTFGKSPQDHGDLYVNIGAPSDNCVEDAPGQCSVEGQHGVIRRYSYQAGINRWDPKFEVLAKGLRNSMGLVSHESGTLLQAENSRDFKEQNEPYDELNLILPGRHYGWPYCYNFQATSPEWKESVDCTKGFQSPMLLLAPHAAPLDLIYYDGDMFPQWKGHLLMSWHGHQPTGSRVVAYPTDAKGWPLVERGRNWSYSVQNSKQVANPQGGSLQSAPYLEIITDWKKQEGLRPSGSPVGLLVASDGSIYIVEDKNKTVLRLARGSADSSETDDTTDAQSQELLKTVKAHRAVKDLESNPELLNAYNWINQNVFQTSCRQCHGELEGSGTEAYAFMIREDWITPASSDSLVLQRLKSLNGLQKMPLGSELPTDTIQYIEKWILHLRSQ